ncbi:EamA family transporter RarD [Aliiroseovarius crassostreae]|uniref:EamA family transporter RarD n=1 Tax=Aliiroseovarius crassostreae TaxID=154981 RepID=UPI0021AF6AA6|nr:EamA family transporter RarD [Aliiroseovarius crassostreae]UWQ07698.1 EamA family transporter RarD [Aliiroseovarius crassostreae]UWQ10803.1 EamA family transporter RarD [Aliiroseovarius crassostreae]
MAQMKDNVDTPRGLAFVIAAYVLWGFLPLYMKALSHVLPAEVVVHRVIWSVPVAGAVLIVMGRTRELREAFAHPRMLAQAALTAALISVNWGIYIWSIANGQALEAALGYYINPLFSIFLGAVLLGERLNRVQMIAISFAATAVVILTLEAGRLPLVAVGLMITWGFYAYFKKSLPIGPNQGFLLEVLILTPFALAYMAYLGATGEGVFLSDAPTTLLLLAAGVVTAVPLLLYANGAKGVRMSTVGILQYIAPTMIFLIAVFHFGEPLSGMRLFAFPLIWLALVIYTVPMLRSLKRS